MTPTHNIKRGVSLYSFQEETFLRKMSLEDCLATASKLGAKGIQIVSEQSLVGFPHLSDAFYEQWHAWMAQYDCTPVCHDAFLDTKRYKGRLLTEEEQIESVVRDLKHAKRLGCKVIRILVSVTPDLMEKCIPYAEEYDVKMGIEIHAPWHLDHPWIQRHIEVMERTGTKHYGLIPDMGMFTSRLPRVYVERMIRNGASPEIAAYVCSAYESRIMAEYIVYEARTRSTNPLDHALGESVRHNVWSNPKRLREYMPYIFHIHAKFYEMQDDGTEYSIPYEQIIPVLIEAGYEGYLCSEYEGNRHIQDAFEVDSVEQVRRHQAMLKRLLGEEDATSV